MVSAYHRASFSAASCQHSGDGLFALPIGHRLVRIEITVDDEAVRVAVGLRLRLDLCIPHQCQCGSPVDAVQSSLLVLWKQLVSEVGT